MSTLLRPANAASAAPATQPSAGMQLSAKAALHLPAYAELRAQPYTGLLAAQLHTKPGQFAPVQLQPVAQPQLIVQLAGSTQLELVSRGQRRRYASPPGSVYLNTPQQPPYEMALRGSADAAITSIQLDLPADLLRRTAAAAGLDADRLELLDGICLDAPLLRQLGYSLAAALEAPGSVDALYADTVAQMLAVQLVYGHSTRPRPVPAPRGLLPAKRLALVRDYVQASLQQPITLESLAAVACLSPYHFCRVFKRTTGLSPAQYVAEQRMSRARHLLQAGKLSVAQVARAVGYRHAGHFAQLFQRHTGLLPAELLRAARP
jgi:AraC family transcriptional regulator